MSGHGSWLALIYAWLSNLPYPLAGFSTLCANPAWAYPQGKQSRKLQSPRTTVALVPSTTTRTNTLDIKQRMQAVLRAEAEAINAVDVSQDFVDRSGGDASL